MKGCKVVLPPSPTVLDGLEVKFCYLRDPDGSLVELIDWGIPLGVKEGVKGMNHVGFGVTNVEKSLTLYRDILGFEEVVFDFSGFVTVMAPMFPKPINMRIIMLANKYQGGMVEIIHLLSPYELKPKPSTVKWGHVGTMEFGIGVSNIEKVYDELQKKGVQFKCPPQTVSFPPIGEWKYVYMVEPDDHFVSIVEY